MCELKGFLSPVNTEHVTPFMKIPRTDHYFLLGAAPTVQSDWCRQWDLGSSLRRCTGRFCTRAVRVCNACDIHRLQKNEDGDECKQRTGSKRHEQRTG